MLTRTELKSRPLSHPKKIVCLLYSLFSYLFFLLTFLYFIGFLGNVGVHKNIDSGTGLTWPWALLVDVLLISLFAIQHSCMARKSFKTGGKTLSRQRLNVPPMYWLPVWFWH